MMQLAIATLIVIAVIAIITLVLSPFALIAGVIYGAYRKNRNEKARI